MKDKPIITSRTDLDFYEYPMGELFWKYCPSVPVELAFINRTTSVRLADMIDLGELREQLEAYQTLAYTRGELDYILGIYEYKRPMFEFDYIDFLRKLTRLPDFELGRRDGQLDLRFYGPAAEVTYWEIPSMIIVKSLYHKALMKGMSRLQCDAVEAEGRLRFARKVPEIKSDSSITVADFGTRRRHSIEMQRYVVEGLKEECPDQFKGTSNVLLAREFEVPPVGTNSHKGPMVYSGVYWDEDNLDPACSQRRFLTDWESQHGLALSIFLSDTWSSDWFFKNVVTPERLARWKGARHDSAKTIEYAEKRIADYRAIDVDPREKFVVFADGLTVAKMKHIAKELWKRIGYTFGWGSDLTDDVGFELLSIVTKVTRANGHEVAKLSDNIEKATGSPEAIERAKRLIGYTNTYAAKCVS